MILPLVQHPADDADEIAEDYPQMTSACVCLIHVADGAARDRAQDPKRHIGLPKGYVCGAHDLSGRTSRPV